MDSLRYDITYTVINFLPTFPFILCDSIQGKPVVLFFSDFSTSGPEFYIPAEENLALLKGQAAHFRKYIKNNMPLYK